MTHSSLKDTPAHALVTLVFGSMRSTSVQHRFSRVCCVSTIDQRIWTMVLQVQPVTQNLALQAAAGEKEKRRNGSHVCNHHIHPAQ